MTQTHQTEEEQQKYDFEFRIPLTPELAEHLLGMEHSPEKFCQVIIEAELTEREAIQAHRHMMPERAGNAPGMVRNCLRTEQMSPVMLTDEALPALADEYTEHTGFQYRSRSEEEIPIGTYAKLLVILEYNHWRSRGKSCRIPLDEVLEEKLDIDEFLTAVPGNPNQEAVQQGAPPEVDQRHGY